MILSKQVRPMIDSRLAIPDELNQANHLPKWDHIWMHLGKPIPNLSIVSL